MNENKRIDNPRIKSVKYVSALKIKKYALNHYKNNGLIFNVQNFQLLNWYLPREEIFQVHGQ